MARYRMEDSTIVDTKNASQKWDEVTYWDGRNHRSSATGSQWNHQELYRSRRGRYYLVHSSQYEGVRDHAEWVSPQEAARWLLLMGHPLPQDLAAYAEEVSE